MKLHYAANDKADCQTWEDMKAEDPRFVAHSKALVNPDGLLFVQCSNLSCTLELEGFMWNRYRASSCPKLGGAVAKEATSAKRQATRRNTIHAQVVERDLVVCARRKEVFLEFIPHWKVLVTINGREFVTCANAACTMRILQL